MQSSILKGCRERLPGKAAGTASGARFSVRVQAAERFNHQVALVLGTQWGDEGKGKLVDILAQQYDIVARSQVSNRE
jgi:hypothetical protein